MQEQLSVAGRLSASYRPEKSPNQWLPSVASPELTLLCAVVAPPAPESDERVRALLATAIDWDRVVQSAYDHSLAPLFCSRLLEDFSDRIPADLRQAMQTHLDLHYARVGKLVGALLEIVGKLESSGIATIPFKGPALAQQAFGNPCLRFFLDLDILLWEKDIEKAVACLAELGYRNTSDFTPRRESAVRRYGGQTGVQNPQSGIYVEPHWALTPSTMAINLDYAELWRRAGTQTLCGRPIRALAPEHEVLMICIHAAKEGWRSLKPVVDLSGYLNRHPQLDWGSLTDQARRWGCLRMLLLGLHLVHTLLGVETPPSCRALITRDVMVERLSLELSERLQQGKPMPADPYRVDRYALALRERGSDKLRFFIRTVFTPRVNHYEFVSLPDALRWLYVPIKVGLDYVAVPIWKRLKRSS